MTRIRRATVVALVTLTALASLVKPSASQAASGTLPMPERPVANPVVASKGFRRAVARGTRTTEGIPGPGYWQQSAHYTITARLDAEQKRLAGTTRIRYHNVSPDSLRRLAVQLIQNFHREDAPRLAPAEITGGYRLTRVYAAGQVLDEASRLARPGYRVGQTSLMIVPPMPVAPGDSLLLELDWSFRIPKAGAGGRMGWDGDDCFFLAYWYPQMAVYDDVEGWHEDPFLGYAEFYAGFAAYDVTLDVPQGWLVQGTGQLVNELDVLAPDIIRRLRLAEASDTVVHVITEADLRPDRTRAAADGRARWRFHADSVRDVAYSITRRSLWDVVGSDVGDRNGDGRAERTRAEAIFRPSHESWRQVAGYARHALTYHSHHTGVPYPYSHATAVEGTGIISGGMEFPMMTIIGGYDDRGDSALYDATSHELAHNWIPMIVSTDERRRAWMDEGTTDFNTITAMADFYPGYDGVPEEMAEYLRAARAGEEGTLMRYSDHLDTPAHYPVHAYSKPASLLFSLRSLLGADIFTRAYQGYLRTWAFRHPTPWDFFNYFNSATGQDLSWFWRTWYYETWVLDQSIERVTESPLGTEILVRDLGDAFMPTRLTITLTDGDTLQREIPVATWLRGTRTATIRLPAGRQVAQVEIDADGAFPDVVRKNGFWAAEASALPAGLPHAIRSGLVRGRATLLAQGYRPDGDQLSGTLDRGATDRRILKLDGAVQYAILAVCDAECDDIDLRLVDAFDSTLAEAAGTDDTPLVQFTTPGGGQYMLDLVMFGCQASTCSWVGQVFRR